MVRRGLTILLGLVMASSHTGGFSRSRSATASVPAGEDYRSLRSRIAAEIDRLGPHPWAGVYELRGSEFLAGTGPFVRLDLAPESGFVLERLVGCLLTPVFTEGIVIAERGRLRLQPRTPIYPWPPSMTVTEDDRDPLEGELLPLTQGGQRYLVPVAAATAFCNGVNGGHESDRGRSLLRRYPESPATLEDELPLEVARCLRKEPLRTRIVSVGEVQGYGPGETVPGSTRKLQTGSGPLPVVIDAGAGDGVWVGMELYTVCPPCSYQPAEVIAVGERTSQAVFEAGWLKATPEPGWLLSTLPGDPLE